MKKRFCPLNEFIAKKSFFDAHPCTSLLHCTLKYTKFCNFQVASERRYTQPVAQIKRRVDHKAHSSCAVDMRHDNTTATDPLVSMSYLTHEDKHIGESPSPVPFRASNSESLVGDSALRNAVRVNVAQPEDVESTPANPSAVRPSDIVKIFLADDEIAEVTTEQVQRVRMSK